MLHRNFLRRGVSLEVILEEDDAAEVSFDPTPLEDDTDCSSPSTPPSSKEGEDKSGGEAPNNFERLREEKERRKRRKEEEEGDTWRGLEKQRSLSCETLTILDVGEDEFSREQWEEDARDWASSEDTNNGHQIQQSISRRKILLQATSRCDGDEDHYEAEPENREILYEDDFEVGHVSCVRNGRVARENDGRLAEEYETHTVQHDLTDYGNREDLNVYEEIGEPNNQENLGLSQDTIDKTSSSNVESYKSEDEKSARKQKQPTKFESDQIFEDSPSYEDDSWITVGELETDILEPAAEDTVKTGPIGKPVKTDHQLETERKIDEDDLSRKSKGVRFRDEPEYVNERAELVYIDDSNEDEDTEERTNKPTSSEERANRPTSSEERTQKPTSSEDRANKLTSTPTKKPVQKVKFADHSQHLLDVRAGRELFEAKSGCGKPSSSSLYDRLTSPLENTRVLILENSSSPFNPIKGSEYHRGNAEDLDRISHSSSGGFNNHNAELHPEELPPPHTVASVRQLFEGIPTSLALHHAATSLELFQSRFDHVRSNPSSKIFRLDRERRHQSSSVGSRSPSSTSSSVSSCSSLPKNFKGEERRTLTKKGSNPSSKGHPSDFSSTGIHLRKPCVARGFDVRKALRENPRYFHIRYGERSKEKDKSSTTSKPSTSTSIAPQRGGTITYSYVEAKHRSQRGTTTSLRWTKETIDRSDAESMSSESSEDSGVSKDFSSSSIITSFTKSSSRTDRKARWTDPTAVDDRFASDPSFKWIDPSVLSKIRSMGTTVIYFGPRHRPQGGSRRDKRPPWLRGALKESTPEVSPSDSLTKTLTQIVEREDENELERQRGGIASSVSRDDQSLQNVTHEEAANDQVIFAKKGSYGRSDESPKIVGVKHKRESRAEHSRGSKSCEGQHPIVKPFPHRNSIFLPKRDGKNKTAGNSIIYDFTQKQQQP